MDKRGRVFVCDRSNTRIQIFDQEGKHLATWHQFGMPSGIAFSVNDEDLIYVFDSESDNVDNPGFEQGIRIGDALNGWVKYFILDQGGNPGTTTGSGAEFGTVDKFGNVFAENPGRAFCGNTSRSGSQLRKVARIARSEIRDRARCVTTSIPGSRCSTRATLYCQAA